MDLLDQPRELGRRVGGAIGYSPKTQAAIAAELGRDERTIRSYVNEGGLSSYSRDQREAFVRDVARVTGCPPEFLGLSPAPGEDWERRLFCALQGFRTGESAGSVSAAERATKKGPLPKERP